MTEYPTLYHVIKDPVHGTMQFTTMEDHWVKPFIDSPNFQRLRHIKQLGLGDYIFPGATHSRFNHCLGCAYVAGQIAHKIGLNDAERQLVMVACLLHDIGHGPFSHAFEDLYVEKIIHHEDWTPYFLADFANPQFFAAYHQINPKHPLNAEKFKLIEQMIMHTVGKKTVLSDIVSSQLDADRLDYLLRDSHFCGVRYGEYDFRWMLHCMTIIRGAKQDEMRLGITHKGIGVVEHYLMARRLMLNNIYRSHKKLAIEAMLIRLLALLANELANQNTALHQRFGNSRLGQFLLAVHQFNQSLQAHKNQKTKMHELKHAFLTANYQYYKNLCDYDVYLCIEELAAENLPSELANIAKRIHHRIMPKIVPIDYARMSQIAARLAEFKQQHHNDFSDWQLMLIEEPHQSYSRCEDPILVLNENKEIKPIEQYSFMLSAISDHFEHVAFLSIDQTIALDPRILHLIRELQ